MQCDIHEKLIESPADESCIDADDRMQTTKGHTRGHGHSVLFGNANVEDAVWELLCHCI